MLEVNEFYEWHLLIPADNSKPLRFVKIRLRNHNHLDLDDLYDVLGCSWIETVNCRDRIMLLVDEVGKCYDESKAVNWRASIFYPGSYYGDMIVGDALIGCRDLRMQDHGVIDFDFCELPQDLFERICRVLNVDPKKVLKCAE